jgi:thioredoxin-related protein
MIRILVLSLLALSACTNSSTELRLYSKKIGFNSDKATLLVSLENCSYCFGEYQETVEELDKLKFNVVIISSQKKKASLFASPDDNSVFIDNEKIAIKLGLIESLPIIILPSGERLEIFSPEQLLNYAETYVP